MSLTRTLLGLLLVAAGLFWLAAAQGWVQPDWPAIHTIVSRILAWWPLLLVAAGAGMLFTRRVGAWLALLAVVGSGLAVLWAVSAAFAPWAWPVTPGRHVTEIHSPGAAGGATMEVEATAASLVLTGGAGGRGLVVVESSLPLPYASAARRGGGAADAVSIESALPLSGVVRLDEGTRWEEISISAAAAQVRLDLDGVTLGDLRVDAASSRLVGSIGQVVDGARITVNGAAAFTYLEFPAGVGVEVTVEGRNGRLDLPGFRRVGDRWRSANWEEAPVRVRVDHQAAVYRLAIRAGGL